MVTPTIQRKISKWEAMIKDRSDARNWEKEQVRSYYACSECKTLDPFECSCVEHLGHQILIELLDKRHGD